jgi:hypothetical protein
MPPDHSPFFSFVAAENQFLDRLRYLGKFGI